MPELMKGHTFKKHGHKMTYPCVAELKYDEIRCHVKVHLEVGFGIKRTVQFLSYAGKPLANMEQFAPKFAELSRVTGWLEFDCGFEVNGNFNDSYRWVRSTKGLPDDLVNASTRFVLFDLPENTGTYIMREHARDECVRVWCDYVGYGVVFDVPASRTCINPEEVHEYFNEATELGFEGLMVKSLDHVYERGARIYGWLKYKPEEDADGVITELHEAICGKDQPHLGLRKGDRLGRTGSVTVRMADGSTASPHGIAFPLGRDMFDHPEKYIGQWCEFKYMEIDRQGGYRHPTFHRLREAKE